jgi:hypothetical protein
MKPADVSLALTATLSVAAELCLTVDDAIVMQNSNRLAVRLAPCDVLTRVAAPGRRNHEVALFELGIARELEGTSSLVGVLDPRVEQIVHVRDGFAVTFWKYYETLPGGATVPAEYALALEGMHAGMRPLDVAAPHFTDRVDEAETIVRDRAQSPDLADADRELLFNSLRSLGRRSSTAVRTNSYCTVNPMPATS